MKKILLLLIMLVPINCYADNLLTVEMSSCIDGDTAQFIVNGEKRKVRFIGIDAPEMAKDNKPAEDKAIEASVYTCNSLQSATKLQIEYDENASKEDKYNRDLAWVYTDGELLETKIVEKGLAIVDYIYDDNYLHVDEICGAESKARKEKLGIWENSSKESYCVGGAYTRKQTNKKVNKFIKFLIKSPVIVYIFFFFLIIYGYRYLKKKRRI